MSDTKPDHPDSPTGDSSIDQLRLAGDPLEKIICRDYSQLSIVLGPYARIWANHIYPRRIGNGSHLNDKWQKFGGHHYTALIRLHHALNAKAEILKLCEAKVVEQGDYELVLKVQELSAGFWDNLGAAIDNIANAEKEALKLCEQLQKRKQKSPNSKDSSGIKSLFRLISPTATPKLHMAYSRRNQYIHSIVVPKDITEGMVVFNKSHYEDEKTNWKTEKYQLNNIDFVIKSEWEAVLKELGNYWQNLLSWLQKEDKEIQSIVIDKDEIFVAESTPISGSEKFDIPPSGSGNGMI